jgi:excisionase family DNA binding protein
MSQVEENTTEKKAISFDLLPQAISELIDRVTRIEQLLREERSPAAVENEMLNITEATVFLRLTKSTIYSKVCRGEIPAFKTGRRLYFDKQELTGWIKSSRKTTNEDIRAKAERFLSSSKFMPATKRRAHRY